MDGHISRLLSEWRCSLTLLETNKPAGINKVSHKCLIWWYPLHSNRAHCLFVCFCTLSTRIRSVCAPAWTPARNLWSSSFLSELSCHKRRRGTGGHRGAGRGTRWSVGEACWCGTAHGMLLLPVTRAAALLSVMPVESARGKPGDTNKTWETEHERWWWWWWLGAGGRWRSFLSQS